MDPAPSADELVSEARRLVQLAAEEDAELRLLGGLAVALRCPSALRPPLARPYKDIDFASALRFVPGLERAFRRGGYEPNAEFNAFHGRRRLSFVHAETARDVDVFLDEIQMCHRLEVGGRLAESSETLSLSDLLLLKLQVVETNERDLLDATAILADHALDRAGIDAAYIAELLAEDWGWWRTATAMLRRMDAEVRDRLDPAVSEVVHERIAGLLSEIERTPKSRRWRMRARLGDRVRWYELPEEAG